MNIINRVLESKIFEVDSNNISIPQKLVLIYSFLVYGLSNVFGNTFPYAKYIIYGLLFMGSFACILLQIKRISLKRLILPMILVIIGVVLYYLSNAIAFVTIVLASFASINMPYKKVFKYGFYSQLIFLIFVSFISLLGFNKEFNLGWLEGGFFEIRHCLGFSHPNTAATYYLFTTFLFFAYKPRPHNAIYVLFMLANFVIYMLTGSRTTLIISVAFIFAIFIAKYIKFNKIIAYSSSSLFVLFTIFVVGLVFLAHDTKFNSFLSGRLSYAYSAMLENKIHFFIGTNLDYPLDIGYISLIYSYGLYYYLIYCIIFSIYFIFVGKYMKKEVISQFVIIGVFYLIFTLSEVYIFNYFSVPCILVLKIAIENCNCKINQNVDSEYFDSNFLIYLRK